MKNKVLNGFVAAIMVVFLAGCNKEKFCVMNTIPLNKISPYYDGQWQGIIAASDGACYFGTSAHTLEHGGGFFRFDPSTSQIEVLAEDFTKLVGDDMTKNTPQGKCHSPIIEVDGTLYLATHLAAYWKEVLDKYAGSYFLSYNMKEKKWTNYGINKPGFSTYSAIAVDPKLGKAYAMVVPFAPKDKAEGNHLYQIDLKTKERRDLGRIADGKASFWFYLDDKSRLWTTVWRGGNTLHCYDPATDSLTTYENAFPEPKLAPDGKPGDTKAGRSWTWAKAIDGGKRCLYTQGDRLGGDERLWIFDPSKDIKSKEAFTPVCYVGTTFLSVALANNRLYFTQRADYASSRGYSIEENRDLPADKNGYHVNNLHLRSVSLDQNDPHPLIDHGRIIDKDGRTPAFIGSLAADNKGNIFMSGGWLVKSGDQPTMEFIYKASDKKEYTALKGPDDQSAGEVKAGTTDGKNYKPLKRGEFFSWVNISNDLK
jgi:hypothetical protein